MTVSRRIWLGTLLSLCFGVLSACGGGGGGSSSPPGSFTLSTTNVSFSGKYLAAAPPAQTITMHLTDSGAATAGAGYANGQTEAPWLTVTAAGSGADYTFTLSVNTTSMSAGTYSTVLTLGTADANNNILQTQAVQVSYSLREGLTLSGGIGSMYLVAGDSAASLAKQFTVADPTSSSVQWTAQSNASWLLAPSGTQSGTGTFPYSINMTGLSAGTYTGTLTITNAADPTDTATISVSITLQAPMFTSYVTSSINLGGSSGRDLSPQPFTFSLDTDSNEFPYTATVTTTSGGNWLTVTPASGTVSGSMVTINASVSPQQLVSGTYQGQIQLQANVNGTLVTRNVPVTLQFDQNRLLVDAEGAALSSFPSRQTLTRTLGVANTWGVSGVHWQTQSDTSWLTATASGTTGSPLVLSANPTGLAPGQYIGHITISAPDAGIENQQTVRVGLTVGTTDPVGVLDVPGSAVTQVATSPVEPLVFVVASPTGPINIYDTNTGGLVRTLSGVFTQLSTMVISGDGQTLYVMDGTESFPGDPSLIDWTVHEFDVNSGALLTSVSSRETLGGGDIPYFAYARPGAHPALLIPGLGGGTVIDLNGNNTTSYFNTTYLNTIAVSPDQTKLYLVETGGVSPSSSIYASMTWSELPAVGLITTPTTVFNSATGWDVAVSADASHVYAVPGFEVLSGTDLSLQTTLAGNIGANSVATSWNGLLATGSVGDIDATSNNPDSYNIWIYDPSLNLLPTLQSDPGTGTNAYSLIRSGLQFSGDGTRLVSATQGGFRIQTLPAPPP